MDQRDTDRLAELFEHALTLPQEDRRRYARDACVTTRNFAPSWCRCSRHTKRRPTTSNASHHQLQHAALTPTQSFEPSSTSDRGIENEVRLRVGQRFGHYEIGRFLGRGGMSEVWEAEDLDTGRHVALKALGWTLRTAADRARFLREGRLAASRQPPEHRVRVRNRGD